MVETINAKVGEDQLQSKRQLKELETLMETKLEEARAANETELSLRFDGL